MSLFCVFQLFTWEKYAEQVLFAMLYINAFRKNTQSLIQESWHESNFVAYNEITMQYYYVLFLSVNFVISQTFNTLFSINN